MVITMEAVDRARRHSTAVKERARAERARSWTTASGMEGPASPSWLAELEAFALWAERHAEARVLQWIAQGCREVWP
jgi:hypothetical protein